MVLTSGMGGSYERGLIVGAVISVSKTANNTSGSIVVAPNQDASVLEEVIVVFEAPDMFAIEKEEAEKKAKEEAEKRASEAASSLDEDEYYEDDYYLEDDGLESWSDEE